jgi:hypothetical protein
MTERRTIEIHIVMDETGAFVVDADLNEAAERAETELGEDADVRQVSLTIELLPPSQSAKPTTVVCQID